MRISLTSDYYTIRRFKPRKLFRLGERGKQNKYQTRCNGRAKQGSRKLGRREDRKQASNATEETKSEGEQAQGQERMRVFLFVKPKNGKMKGNNVF